MSNTKTVMSQAANTLVKPLEVEDVFSTYLYEGNATARSITNGIDLDGEGGLVWIKNRESGSYNNNFLSDTENGANNFLATNQTNGLRTLSGFGLTAFNSDGFDMGTAYGNENGIDTASWTFRKAPKFFDVVTYTGNGPSNTQNISHNLGTAPGMLVVKSTSVVGNWHTWHRGFGDNGYIMLNSTNAKSTYTALWDNTAPTATHFTVSEDNNTNGVTYVAYLFAHNDGGGEFGPDGDADIIKCGSYTGNGSSDGPEIDLGFEPQWVMLKRSDSTADWVMQDVMRGMIMDSGGAYIKANDSAAEFSTTGYIQPEPTGFKVRGTGSSQANASGGNYIYIAIRRDTKVPESATEVFAIDTRTAVSSISGTDASFYAGFAPDMALWRTVDTSANNLIAARLIQSKLLYTNLTNAESSSTNGAYYFDKENGWFSLTSADADSYSWMWKRAPNYFDVVAYTGDGVAGRTVSHNLGVAPEMMWVKERANSNSWGVYHSSLGATKSLVLNLTNAEIATTIWNSTEPSATDFTVGSASVTNRSGGTYIAYLFASLPGISKVGSYTGDGTSNSSKVIDCGFTSGARFVLIKAATGEANNWFVFDTVRGIVSGFDPRIFLNTTSAEATNADYIDPHNSGFIVGVASNTVNSVNVSGVTYIFYAIA